MQDGCRAEFEPAQSEAKRRADATAESLWGRWHLGDYRHVTSGPSHGSNTCGFSAPCLPDGAQTWDQLHPTGSRRGPDIEQQSRWGWTPITGSVVSNAYIRSTKSRADMATSDLKQDCCRGASYRRKTRQTVSCYRAGRAVECKSVTHRREQESDRNRPAVPNGMWRINLEPPSTSTVRGRPLRHVPRATLGTIVFFPFDCRTPGRVRGRNNGETRNNKIGTRMGHGRYLVRLSMKVGQVRHEARSTCRCHQHFDTLPRLLRPSQLRSIRCLVKDGNSSEMLRLRSPPKEPANTEGPNRAGQPRQSHQ